MPEKKVCKTGMEIEGFCFEKAGFSYPGGQQIEHRLRVERKSVDGMITSFRIEHIRPPDGKVFYRDRLGLMTVVEPHIGILGVPTYPDYYEVKQSFRRPTSGDTLGGFQSGNTWDIVGERRIRKVLKDFREKGFKQVPYAVSQKTPKE